MTEFVNIYPQFTYHHDGRIIGTREGLIQLRHALDSTIETGQPRQALVFSSDGEGYVIEVECLDEAEMGKCTPYYVENEAHA
jgi:hypothetical protein